MRFTVNKREFLAQSIGVNTFGDALYAAEETKGGRRYLLVRDTMPGPARGLWHVGGVEVWLDGVSQGFTNCVPMDCPITQVWFEVCKNGFIPMTADEVRRKYGTFSK